MRAINDGGRGDFISCGGTRVACNSFRLALQPARLPLQPNSRAETVLSPIPGAGRRSKGLPDCRRRVWPDERHEQLPGDNRARSIGWREIRQWRSREYCDLALALSLPRRQLPSNVVRRLQSK